MQLVLAEKPSVARDLARVLGVRAQGEHCFEGERFVITWAIGHLVELDEPASYDERWRAWRLDLLPMLPTEFRLRASSHARAQLKAVSALLRDRRFRSVINACDAGREGELIFRYVYQYAHSSLPSQRLWVSSLTDEAIRRGFAALRPGTQLDPLADAARSRSEADWLVGMNATRAITARGREAGHDALYSIGRVQTPTLAMLVARELQIRNFVPRPYWEVRGDFKTADGARFTAGWRHEADTRLASDALATEVVTRDRPAPAVVERTRSRTVREAPPLLFDLTSLQRTANRRYHFSAARTLEIAQALYERHKVLTYPRTDSRHLTTDVLPELPQLFASLSSIPDYAPFASALVANPPTPSRRVIDDTKVGDHHAIIPTSKPARLESLDRDEARIYDMVVRRFLGAFYPDAEFAVMEAWIKVGAGTSPVPKFPDEAPRPAPSAPSTEVREPTILATLPPMPDRYLARGRARTVAGWQDVAGIGADAASSSSPTSEPAAMLPPLVEGQPLAGAYASQAKQTTPPPRYSEATLLGAMESAGKSIDDEALRAAMKDRGLGTPATRASIIETLLRRAYIVRDKQHLTPTAMGIALIESLPVASLASPELTGSWEARLAQIARGEDSRAQFMGDIARYVADMVAAIRVAPPPAAPPPGSSPPQQQAWGRNGKRGGKRGGGRSSWSKRGSSGSGREGGSSGAGREGGSWSKRGGSSSSSKSSGASRSNGSGSSRSNRGGSSWSNGGGSSRSNGGDSSWSKGNSAAAPPSAPRRATRPASPRPTAPSPAVGSAVDLACPCCRQGSLLAGARGWGCARWREGCRFVIWFETAGRRITPAQLRDLVMRGKTRKATFEPVRGAPQAGRLVLDVSATTATGAARFEPS